MDAQGYVKITGFRIKDMIIRGGENVYPREVEEFLYTHPDIKVQVFGVPMLSTANRWLRGCNAKNRAITAADIAEFCAGQITHSKCPAISNWLMNTP